MFTTRCFLQKLVFFFLIVGMKQVQRPQLQKTGLVASTRGYEPNYFLDKTVPQDLLCGICLCVCKETTQLPCTHVFCRACIGRWAVLRDPQPSCPLCRSQRANHCDFKSLDPDPVLQLNVTCTNQTCEWHGTLQERSTHRKECKFEDNDQQCRQCGVAGSRFVLRAHLCNENTTVCAICANACGMLCIECEVDTSTHASCKVTKHLICDHEFHTHCIERWYQTHNECPLC